MEEFIGLKPAEEEKITCSRYKIEIVDPSPWSILFSKLGSPYFTFMFGDRGVETFYVSSSFVELLVGEEARRAVSLGEGVSCGGWLLDCFGGMYLQLENILDLQSANLCISEILASVQPSDFPETESAKVYLAKVYLATVYLASKSTSVHRLPNEQKYIYGRNAVSAVTACVTWGRSSTTDGRSACRTCRTYFPSQIVYKPYLTNCASVCNCPRSSGRSCAPRQRS